MKKEKLLILLGKSGTPYSKIRPDLSSRNIDNKNKCNFVSLSGFGTAVDVIVILLILLSLTYLFVYVRLIVYNKSWMNHAQELEGEKLVYLDRLRNGLESEDFNNPGVNLCRRQNYLKSCKEENIKWKNDISTGKNYEKYFNDNIKIPYHKEVKLLYDKCLSNNVTDNDIFKKISNFLKEMEYKYNGYLVISNNTQKSSFDNILNLTKMIADMKIFYNIDSLISSTIELDKRHGHKDGTEKVHGIFTVKINRRIFDEEHEVSEKAKIFHHLKFIYNGKHSDDEYHKTADNIFNVEKNIFKNIIKDKNDIEIVKLKDIHRRWKVMNIHSYVNYISRFNRDLNRKMINNEIDITIEKPSFITFIDNIAKDKINFRDIKNYILYRGILSIIESFNQTIDSAYCSRIIGENLPLLNARIINEGITLFDKNSMETLAQKYVYSSYNSIMTLIASMENVNMSIKNDIRKTYDSMRILCGAPRWIFNDVEIYKYYGRLPISEEQTFNEMIESLNKFKEMKKLDGILGHISVDEFLYSDGGSLSKNVYYCPITNTIYLPSSAFFLMLKSFNDVKLSLNNVILSKVGYELSKVIIPYKNRIFNKNISDNYISDSLCLNNVVYSKKKEYVQKWDENTMEEVRRHMIAIQSSYSIYNNYVIVFQNEYFPFHNNVRKDPKEFEDFYFYYEIKEYLCTIEDENVRNIITDLLTLMHPFQISRVCHSPFNSPKCLNWLSSKWFEFPSK
uniref:Peptidase_M13_N domain-containing protein n=1 Tax=Parastrongyloides trichosuri TaxID=131310 RepID=A0A0N5A432_PARTI